MFNRIKNRVLNVVNSDPAIVGPPSRDQLTTTSSTTNQHHHATSSARTSYVHVNNNSNNTNRGGGGGGGAGGGGSNNRSLPDKFTYSRPDFLKLSSRDELKASADHHVRPIIVPRDDLPCGYAECVNSGKSAWNEDQAAIQRQILSHPSKQYPDLPYTYYGIFDGHAGYGAALAASHQFHYILHEKLVDVIDLLLPAITTTANHMHGGAEDRGGSSAQNGNSGSSTVSSPIDPSAPPRIMTFDELIHRSITKDEIIIGALESAFYEMDTLLAEDRDKYRNAGGCTALVTLFIFGKMYVANAGDSRAVLAQRVSDTIIKSHPNAFKLSLTSSTISSTFQMRNGNNLPITTTTTLVTPLHDKKSSSSANDNNDDTKNHNNTDKDTNNINNNGKEMNDNVSTYDNNKNMHIFPVPFSYDHTPDTERSRIMAIGKLNPVLMGNNFVATEYAKRPATKDLGTSILYREGNMRGWAYKTITRDDLKMSIVTGEGKRSRLMGTIGVTRGFGDHDLRALAGGLRIKPFLSSHPDVIYRDLTKIISVPLDGNVDGDYGVLLMATDGLWDVIDCNSAAKTVFEILNQFPNEKHRYTMVAQQLVAMSRGWINDFGQWRPYGSSKLGVNVDDVSVIVIPVYQYYKEYVEWQNACFESHRKHLDNPIQDSTANDSTTNSNNNNLENDNGLITDGGNNNEDNHIETNTIQEQDNDINNLINDLEKSIVTEEVGNTNGEELTSDSESNDLHEKEALNGKLLEKQITSK